MRILPVVLLSLFIAGPAAAQTIGLSPMERLRMENRLSAEQDLARRQAQDAQREAYVARERAATASTIQGLRSGVSPSSPAMDARIAADAETMARRRARELAESNARILAIKPASGE